MELIKDLLRITTMSGWPGSKDRMLYAVFWSRA